MTVSYPDYTPIPLQLKPSSFLSHLPVLLCLNRSPFARPVAVRSFYHQLPVSSFSRFWVRSLRSNQIPFLHILISNYLKSILNTVNYSQNREYFLFSHYSIFRYSPSLCIKILFWFFFLHDWSLLLCCYCCFLLFLPPNKHGHHSRFPLQSSAIFLLHTFRQRPQLLHGYNHLL